LVESKTSQEAGLGGTSNARAECLDVAKIIFVELVARKDAAVPLDCGMQA
jgi:hypothetical protein